MKIPIALSLVMAALLGLSPGFLRGQTEDALEIARMILCSGIEEREPMNPSDVFSLDIDQVYCFTEVRNAGSPKTITHRWYYGDQLMAEIPLDVQGHRYRTWSSKKILASATGEWRVEVVDEAGQVLGDIVFRISPLEE
jgi:hypothetical protein